MSETAIKSKTIKSCAFNEKKGEMTIRFSSGGRYTYLGVTQDLYDGMVKADSAGSFFHSNIRGKFPSTKLEDE